MERDEYYSSLREAKDYLAHHGVKGQKWGERKYQNADGSLTPEGRIHYGVGNKDNAKPTYSKRQFKRDAAVYGRSSAKRIKRDVEKKQNKFGIYGLSSAKQILTRIRKNWKKRINVSGILRRSISRRLESTTENSMIFRNDISGN